jgi:hypothetical protein
MTPDGFARLIRIGLGREGRACCCGAPGEPCPVCNRADGDTVPELPDGFVIDTKTDDRE